MIVKKIGKKTGLFNYKLINREISCSFSGHPLWAGHNGYLYTLYQRPQSFDGKKYVGTKIRRKNKYVYIASQITHDPLNVEKQEGFIIFREERNDRDRICHP